MIGAHNEPEALRRDLGSYEQIGKSLARDCHEETQTVWGHSLLRHNLGEIQRMRQVLGLSAHLIHVDFHAQQGGA